MEQGKLSCTLEIPRAMFRKAINAEKRRSCLGYTNDKREGNLKQLPVGTLITGVLRSARIMVNSVGRVPRLQDALY